MGPVDILQPFQNADKNRTEFFLIEYGGFIINRAANLVYSMLQHISEYEDRYPNINLFKGANPRTIYEITKYFDVFEMLVYLAGRENGVGTDEEYYRMYDDFIKLETINNSKYTMTTMFSFALGKMMQQTCCEKAYILKNAQYQDWELRYMQNIYRPIGNKIEFIEGEFEDFYMEEKDKLTTIFLTQPDKLIDIASIDGHESFTNMQLFIMRLSNTIISQDPETKLYNYTCTDLIDNLEKTKIHVSTIQCEVFDQNFGLTAPPIIPIE